MRGAWSTLALVAVALGLGAYIYFVDSERPDTEAKEKVFAVSADAVEELRVVSKGDTSVLRKTDGTWKLVEPLATDADANEVTTLVNSLTSLELNREVDANAGDLAQYGLAAPKADIRFTASGGATGRIRLGDQTPTGTDLYAVKGDETRVFLVSTFAETSLVRSAFDLRDKRALRFERDKVDGLEITTAAGTTALTRANSEWRLTAPSGARGDYGAIEGLLTRLSTTMMSGIEATDASTLPKYGLDKPAATVVVKAGSASATLAVGTSADGKTFARDLARQMVFTIDAAFATELQKGAGEYRKKELFDLRAFSARQLDITRGADAITLQKKPGTGENALDTWTVTGPGGAAGREAANAAVEDFLTKLSNLRAQAFAAVAPAAATTPVLTVRAQFDENKKEEASIGRGGAEVFAVRPDEAGAMRLEPAPLDEVLKALDAVLAPPPPAGAGGAALRGRGREETVTSGGLRAIALGVLLASGCAAHQGASASPPDGPGPSSPGPEPVAPALATPVDTRATRLAAVVDSELTARPFERAHTAFVVRSLATGETLYQRNGRRWLVPASTLKLLAAVAAAERLGWGFRFETRLVAMAPVVNGTLGGDLVVVGSGDPTINPRHPDRMALFDDWARTLKAKGLRRITGHIIGDDSAFEEPGWGIGWAWDDLAVGYGAAAAALQFNDNEAEVTMAPGATPGAPPVVYVSPSNHGLLLDVQAVTAAAGTAPSLAVARIPGTRFLDVTGRAPLGSAPVTDMVAVANPTLVFAAELRATLMRHGIVVDGAAADLDEHSERPRAADGATLIVDLSPPLSEIIRPMLQWSRNSYAETLVTALDAVPPASAADGIAALRDTLSGLGVAPDGYHVRDGSGLSRNDYLSADTLVETLSAAWRRPDLRGPLLEALPEAGRAGTLSHRLADTAAAGRVHAKTGSMANVRALAGYVRTAADEPLAFAFLCNGFDVRGSDVDARVDAVLLALVNLPPAPRQ